MPSSFICKAALHVVKGRGFHPHFSMNRDQAVECQYKKSPCLYKDKEVYILQLNYPYYYPQMAFIRFRTKANRKVYKWVNLEELEQVI